MATRSILAEVAAAFEARTGERVMLTSIGGVDVAKRLRAGEAHDVVVLAADALAALAHEGRIIGDSVRGFAVSATAVAVPKGAPAPRGLDAQWLYAFVSNARAVAVSTGPSGVAVRNLLAHWNSADAVLVPIVEAPPGMPVAALLARGDADIGFQQLSELQGADGIDIVGTVPASLLPLTTFATGVPRAAIRADQARAFISSLLDPSSHPILRRHGMEPPL
jgi:molybdate transport system substrate-binding protein